MTDAQPLTTDQALELGYEREMQGMANVIDLADDAIERIMALLCKNEPTEHDEPIEHEIHDAQSQWAAQAYRRWRSFADTWNETERATHD